jgi:hypothetical protein
VAEPPAPTAVVPLPPEPTPPPPPRPEPEPAPAPAEAAVAPTKVEAGRPARSHRRKLAKAVAAAAPEPGPPRAIAPAPPADETIRVSLTTDPPGSFICLPAVPNRLGITNGTIQLKKESRRVTLLLYHPGYLLEKVTVAGDENATRTVRLRPLTDDDLQAPPPCR